MRSRAHSTLVDGLCIVLAVVVMTMLVSSVGHAQLHQWSLGLGGTLDDVGQAVARDNSGNYVVIGSFKGSITLGGQSHTSVGGTDFFIVKYDAAGNHLWHKAIGGFCEDAGYGICTDSNGNVIATGRFCGTQVDFNGDGSGPGDPSSYGDQYGGDVFVVKYSSEGAFAWVWTSELSELGVDYGRDVCVDAANNVYVTGADGVWYPTNDQIFLAKLNGSNGSLAWQRVFASTSNANDVGNSVCAYGTEVTITGYFGEGPGYYSICFGGDTLETAGGKDIFVATFDGAGSHLASQRFGGSGNDEGKAICSDANGYAYLTGYFYGGVNFGQNYYEAAVIDIFLLKLTPHSGGVRYTVWDKAFGGDNYDSGQGIAVTGDGEVYITGYFEGHVNFGGEELYGTWSTSNHVFAAKFDASGSHLWSRKWGSWPEGQSGMDIASGNDGFVAITGSFTSGSGENFGGPDLISGGGTDVFVAKYSGNEAIFDLAIGSTFDAGTYTWDAVVDFTTNTASRAEIAYSQSMNCLPCDFFSCYASFSYEENPSMIHGLSLPDLHPAPTYCYEIHSFVNENPCNYLWYAGTFPLTNSYANIYGISHSFNATSCRIMVVWNTKYPSKNNKLYYRKTGTTPWYSMSAAEKECDDPDYCEDPDAYNRTYVGYFSVQEGTSYQFKIATSINGTTYWSSVMSRSSGRCDSNPPIPGEETSPLPAELAEPFVRAYPNPFNPITRVSFNVPAPGAIELTIYGIDGGHVKTLASGAYTAGVHTITWDGTNERGEEVGSGIYFARFEYGEGALTSKLILLR